MRCIAKVLRIRVGLAMSRSSGRHAGSSAARACTTASLISVRAVSQAVYHARSSAISASSAIVIHNRSPSVSIFGVSVLSFGASFYSMIASTIIAHYAEKFNGSNGKMFSSLLYGSKNGAGHCPVIAHFNGNCNGRTQKSPRAAFSQRGGDTIYGFVSM